MENINITKLTGLNKEEVKERIKKYGYNELNEKQVSWISRLFKRFWGPIPWMIEIAAILSAIAQRWEDFSVIMFMLLINAFVDFYQVLVENDKNLSNNQNLILETQILLLQSFLKQNNFNYRFVNWNTLIDSSKFKNVISFDKSWKEKFIDKKTSHPSEEGCVHISEVIYDSFNK